MEKYNYVDSLVITDENEIYLADSFSIDEVVYNSEDCASLYRLENGVMVLESADVLYEYDFEDLYEEYTDYDKECGRSKIEAENEAGEISFYVKAEWENYEHSLQLESEHGINTSYYNITGAEIIEGECFKADGCISQDFPKTEGQDFYKFVGNDGQTYYINETIPFYSDERDYVFELITKEEFEEYD